MVGRICRLWPLGLATLLLMFLFLYNAPSAKSTRLRFTNDYHCTLHGHIPAEDVSKLIFVDFDVPEGTTSIHVTRRQPVKGGLHVLDMGCWDQRGHGRGKGSTLTAESSRGFRGWSSATTDQFTVALNSASPGYIAGPIQPGTWSIALAPYRAVSSGMDYELDVEFGFEPVDDASSPFVPGRWIGRGRGRGRGEGDALVDQSGNRKYGSPHTDRWFRGVIHHPSAHLRGVARSVTARIARLDFIFGLDRDVAVSDLTENNFFGDQVLLGNGVDLTTPAGSRWSALGLSWSDWLGSQHREGEDVSLVQRLGGLAIINQPASTSRDQQQPISDFDGIDGIEVWNDAWDEEDEKALDQWQNLLVTGLSVTALSGTRYAENDHVDTRKDEMPTTVVRAKSLSTPDILLGLRAHHAYIVRNTQVDINFIVEDVDGVVTQLGNTVRLNRNYDRMRVPLFAVLETHGITDGFEAIFISEKGVVHKEILPNPTIASGTQTGKSIRVPISDMHAKFVRVEVRDRVGDMIALTNPIWIG